MTTRLPARRGALIAAAVLAAAVPAGAQRPASVPDFTGLDAYVEQAMKDWKVPGLAIAVVQNDSVILARGYGKRDMNRPEPVDEHTLFAIGSSSKAFTATLVAMLVDEGKMRWDEPATTHLPGLQLFDPQVSRELTVRDLLTHRSGLARGDLMWYATEYGRDEILRRVRFLRPSWTVRSRFGYQNIMYLAAGEAAARAAGKSWDDLIRERFFAPLGMTESSTSIRDLAGHRNVASPHTDVNDTLRVVPWHNIDNIGPAGSINSSVTDMAKWVRLQLGAGKFGGKRLVSASAIGETHTPQVVVPIGADARQLNPFTHLSAYGMGWFLQDYRGRELRQHGGNIDGMSAMVATMPEAQLGLVILTNANGSPVPTIVMDRVLDIALGAPARDWNAEYLKVRTKALAAAKEAREKRLAQRKTGTSPSLPIAAYGGVYSDSLYGDVKVSVDGGKIRLTYGRSLDGELEHWHFDTFRAHWKDVATAPMFVTFALDADGKVQNLTLEDVATFGKRPVAPDTTRGITLAASALGKLTGTFASATPAVSVEVRFADGALELSVPGQPTYTLVPETPTRFRLTGPPGMPAGFFLEYELDASGVKQVRLLQPTPRPTLLLTPAK